MECRQSGLSGYQWCQDRGINPGTFYNWVSKLRKSGYTFPESGSRSSGVPVKQEVVKLDLTDHETPGPAMVEQSDSYTASSIPAVSCIAAEIEYGNIKVRIFNRVDTAVVQNTLKCIRRLR